VPPYVIFHDSTLRDVAARRPSLRELSAIEGIGDTKLERHGESLLDALARRWRGTMHRQLDDKTLVNRPDRAGGYPALKRLGVTLIVNNRPDGEDVGQPRAMTSRRRPRQPGSIIAMCRSPRAGPVRHRGDARGDACRRRGQAVRLLPVGQPVDPGLGRAPERGWGPRENCIAMANQAGFDLGPVAHLLRD
jgi:hypothetical protein